MRLRTIQRRIYTREAHVFESVYMPLVHYDNPTVWCNVRSFQLWACPRTFLTDQISPIAERFGNRKFAGGAGGGGGLQAPRNFQMAIFGQNNLIFGLAMDKIFGPQPPPLNETGPARLYACKSTCFAVSLEPVGQTVPIAHASHLVTWIILTVSDRPQSSSVQRSRFYILWFKYH